MQHLMNSAKHLRTKDEAIYVTSLGNLSRQKSITLMKHTLTIKNLQLGNLHYFCQFGNTYFNETYIIFKLS